MSTIQKIQNIVNTVKEKKEEFELSPVIKRCQSTAKKGHDLASKHLKQLNDDLEQSAISLRERISNISKTSQTSKTSQESQEIQNQLKDQLHKITKELRSALKDELQSHADRLSKFSITLFGRTMAGKSTLMEILTQGKGDSIGQGAQRTTGDVRAYQWRGLEITDVPGIGAFEGKGDEEVALKAAKQADLILFLITDDAPQPIEAKKLVEVRTLGKPIIVICNVKKAIDDPKDLQRFLRNPDEPFNKQRLEEIERQFLEFVHKYTSDYYRPSFLPVHLRARFLSEQPHFLSEQPYFKEYRQVLRKASRFDAVESRICKTITDRGIMFRFRTFIDCVTVPTLALTNDLLKFSGENFKIKRHLDDKKQEIEKWTTEFVRESHETIDAEIRSWIDVLRSQVPSFAEANLEDPSIKAKWEAQIGKANLAEKVRQLQELLIRHYQTRLQELEREIRVGLDLMADLSAYDITAASITDTKKMWRWGVMIVSLILPFFGGIFGGIGASLIGGIISKLFDDREAKERRARRQLVEKLNQHLDDLNQKMNRDMKNWFDDHLHHNLKQVIKQINIQTKTMSSLAKEQHQLANRMNQSINRLNLAFLEEVLDLINATNLLVYVRKTARIPGQGMMLVISENVKLFDQIKAILESFFDEPIWLIIDNGERTSLIAQAIGPGCTTSDIQINEKQGVVHIANHSSLSDTRIQLATQLFDYRIVKSLPSKGLSLKRIT